MPFFSSVIVISLIVIIAQLMRLYSSRFFLHSLPATRQSSLTTAIFSIRIFLFFFFKFFKLRHDDTLNKA